MTCFTSNYRRSQPGCDEPKGVILPSVLQGSAMPGPGVDLDEVIAPPKAAAENPKPR